MVGSSYLGIVQWWAAVEGNPHLAAIAPMNSGDDDYLDRFYSRGGALQLSHRLLWLAENLTPPSEARPPFGNYISHVPLRTADVAAAGIKWPLWRTAVDHPSYDSYWKGQSIREHLSKISVPVLSMGGWFDTYASGDLDMFSRLSSTHHTIETWIGPWSHNPSLKFPTRDFGSQANIGMRLKQAAWFERWLKPASHDEQDVAEAPLLHIFVMGRNVWREGANGLSRGPATRRYT
jgi:putative CocE/NonD family hydrolase